MSKTPPELAAYKKQEDTPYVSHARDLMEQGYKGLNEYTPKVNTMDANTKADIESRLGNIYNRAKEDFGIDYNDTMAKTLAGQYGRMGTMGATANLYRNDMDARTVQRALADFDYNKAENYETDVNRELQRRYNTINMYDSLYGKGAIPQKYDDQNYKLSLTNQDRAYQNDFNSWQTQQKQQQALTDAGIDALGIALAPFTGGASMMFTQAAKDSVNGVMTPNANMTYNGNTGWGSALGAGDTSGSYGGWSKASTGLSDKRAAGLADVLASLSDDGEGSKQRQGQWGQFNGNNSGSEFLRDLMERFKDNPDALRTILQVIMGGGVKI